MISAPGPRGARARGAYIARHGPRASDASLGAARARIILYLHLQLSPRRREARLRSERNSLVRTLELL